mgnify:CR=1 FL=1
MGAKHFGARIARLEDPALLTGQGRFVDDIPLPGLLHAAFVRSHFDGMEVKVVDAPRADEIMVAVALTDSGRPLPRVWRC